MSDYFAAAFRSVPVLAILRGVDPASAAATAEECWRAGIPLVEVSLSGEDSVAALEAVCRRGRELGRSAEAGAAFAVAPGLDAAAAAAARELELPYLPGVATPSEVQQALGLGWRTLK